MNEWLDKWDNGENLTCSSAWFRKPSFSEILNASSRTRPVSISMGYWMIASGFSAAISSMLLPPWVDVMITGPPKRRSNATRKKPWIARWATTRIGSTYKQNNILVGSTTFRTSSVWTPVFRHDPSVSYTDDGPTFLTPSFSPPLALENKNEFDRSNVQTTKAYE